MIEYEQVENSLLRRLSRQIRIRPIAGRYPYEASVRLAAVRDKVSIGHPYLLVAEAMTPRLATRAMLDLLAHWLRDPRKLPEGDFECIEVRTRVERRLG